MLGTKLIKAAAGSGAAEATDADFENTVLLLHGDGNQGATNFSNTGPTKYMAFTDNSTNNFPITVNGDAYGDNFSPFAVPEGNWSNRFDGSGDWLSCASNAAFAFGTGDFTIEAWVYPTSTSSYRTIFTSRGTPSNAVFFGLDNGTLFPVLFTSSAVLTSSVATTLNAWNHVALVRNGGTSTIYVNGVSGGSASNTTDYTQNNCLIGVENGSGQYPWFGYISNLRIVKGTAVYTSAFTPSTSPLTAISGTSLLTCQSNRFVDNSTNNFTITRNGDVAVSPFTPFTVTPNTTDGSGYFDGSGDYLGIPSDAAFTVGTGAVTIEAWIYCTSLSSTYQGIVSGRADVANAWNGLGLVIDNSKLMFTIMAYNNALTDPDNVPLNQWVHVVGVRNGSSNAALFVNGVRKVYNASFTENGTSSAMNIGRYYPTTNNYYFTGHISGVRIVKGTAVYDPTQTTITVPATALTAVTNTQLLTCQYQGSVRNVGFIDSSPYDHRITRVGNTTQGSFSPFSKPDGRWGNYFSSSSDVVNAASNAALNLSGSSFTIEFWVFMTENAPNRQRNFINRRQASGSYTSSYQLYTDNNSNKLKFLVTGQTVVTSTSDIPPLQWSHVAVSWNGSTFRIFINGTLDATTGAYGAGSGGDAEPLRIGRLDANDPVNSYISNVRIIKGTALYTASFTVPTVPLTAITNTSLLTCQSNRFVDNSSNAIAITIGGTPKVTPFSPFPITTAYDPAVNGGSGYFDGSGDYLTAPNDSGYDFTGDFAIELWIYPLKSTYQEIIGTGTSSVFMGSGLGGWNIQIYNSTTALSFAAQNNNSFYVNSHLETNMALMRANSWNHVVVSRVGSTIRGFINGVVGNTTITYSGTIVSNQYLSIGSGWGGNSVAQAYIAGVKITDGTGVTSVTVPTAPPTTTNTPTILCNFTNAGIFDNTGFNNLETVGNAQIDTSVKKYGTGSMELDGSGDFLYLPPTDNFRLGTGDFTIECWVYFNSLTSPGTTQGIFQLSTGGYFLASLGMSGVGVSTTSTTGWLFYNKNSQTFTTTPTVPAVAGQWMHLALVRNSGTTKLYVNGTGDAALTATGDTTDYTATYLGFGSVFGTGNQFNGYMDDIRITKGIARYTSNFTPPDKEFPNIGE